MSHLFSHMWEYSIETKRIDDRQSFKRVRHRQKKKKSLGNIGCANKLHTTEMLTSCNASAGDRSDSHWRQP